MSAKHVAGAIPLALVLFGMSGGADSDVPPAEVPPAASSAETGGAS
jgi:hypothetical protein